MGGGGVHSGVCRPPTTNAFPLLRLCAPHACRFIGPNDIPHLSALVVGLHSIQLTGTIPASLGSLTSLQALCVSLAQLTSILSSTDNDGALVSMRVIVDLKMYVERTRRTDWLNIGRCNTDLKRRA